MLFIGYRSRISSSTQSEKISEVSEERYSGVCVDADTKFTVVSVEPLSVGAEVCVG